MALGEALAGKSFLNRHGLRRSGERGNAFHFEAEFDGFSDSQHGIIEGLGLGVAAVQLRNGGYVIARSVTLDNDVELSRHSSILRRLDFPQPVGAG